MVFFLGLLAPPSITFSDGLSIVVPGGARTPIRTDPVEDALVHGTFGTPKAGDKLGTGTWHEAKPAADGSFGGQAAQRGYFYFRIDSPREEVMLLSESGNNMVFVNGEPRVGDVYMFGYVTIPVHLRKGVNEFLFSCGRGKLTAKLEPLRAPVAIDVRDATTPDVIPTDRGALLAAVVLQNGLPQTVKDAVMVAESDGRRVDTKLPSLPAMSNYKAGLSVPVSTSGKVTLRLRIGGKVLDTAILNLRIRKPGESYKRTFRSEVDDSVQYFGVQPSTHPAANQALFLSLHGASVEGIGQADAYSAKSWGTIVAPTNRRPYGFDWEDTGRLDAMEVLDIGQKMFQSDPTKTYLTGHSMGGHGTWQVGVQFPDRFAAIAPSAGWISFATYGGGARYDAKNPIAAILQRASSASDTLALKNNYRQEAIYILHGDADDNVPVDQARTMRKELATFHHDFDWFEQPGAGHWWDASPEPGADCVDWAPMFDLFARRRKPVDAEVRSIDFTCAEPGVSSKSHWLTILQQEKAFVPSRVQVRFDPYLKRFVATTENVQALEFAVPGGIAIDAKVEVDGATVQVKNAKTIGLIKAIGGWKAGQPSAGQKNPARSGGFKSVFNHRVVLVFGTNGTPQENAWAYAKARFDSETMWYRGNGSLPMVSDDEWLAAKDRTRNVVLIGNARTNSAWGSLVEAGSDFTVPATDSTGWIVLRPMAGTIDRHVGLVGGSDLAGMKLTNRSPYFLSGAGYPDLLVLGRESLTKGSAGILKAGFFGNDWSVRNGDIAWTP